VLPRELHWGDQPPVRAEVDAGAFPYPNAFPFLPGRGGAIGYEIQTAST